MCTIEGVAVLTESGVAPVMQHFIRVLSCMRGTSLGPSPVSTQILNLTAPGFCSLTSTIGQPLAYRSYQTSIQFRPQQCIAPCTILVS